MENASKALIMAGSILIGMIIISLLVAFFGNLQNLQREELSIEEIEQVSEFNKQYDVYARNVYGSELLSIATKVEDYNKREAENKGYVPIELRVTFNSTPNEAIFKEGETYNYVTLLDAVNKIDDEVEKYSSRKESDGYIYKGVNAKSTRTVAQLAAMRTKDLEDFFGGSEKIPKNLNTQIQEYNSIKNLLSQIKQSVFIYDNFEYDENTGRVKTMIYHYGK